jgi:hypothetical protein
LFAEARDTSFRAEKEVSRQFAVPLVVSVPVLLSPGEERQRARRAILEWVGGSFLVVVILAAEFFVFSKG